MFEGKCVRLFTRQFHNNLSDFDMPEIQVSPLDKLVLRVKHLGEYWSSVLNKYAYSLLSHIRPLGLIHGVKEGVQCILAQLFGRVVRVDGR